MVEVVTLCPECMDNLRLSESMPAAAISPRCEMCKARLRASKREDKGPWVYGGVVTKASYSGARRARTLRISRLCQPPVEPGDVLGAVKQEHEAQQGF